MPFQEIARRGAPIQNPTPVYLSHQMPLAGKHNARHLPQIKFTERLPRCAGQPPDDAQSESGGAAGPHPVAGRRRDSMGASSSKAKDKDKASKKDKEKSKKDKAKSPTTVANPSMTRYVVTEFMRTEKSKATI